MIFQGASNWVSCRPTQGMQEDGYPGISPLALAQHEDRAVLSEYHAIGSTGGITMLRKGKWKYVHCASYPPQLFDLESDPEELVDRAADPACRATQAAHPPHPGRPAAD